MKSRDIFACTVPAINDIDEQEIFIHAHLDRVVQMFDHANQFGAKELRLD